MIGHKFQAKHFTQSRAKYLAKEIKKSSKIGYEKKGLISKFACFLLLLPKLISAMKTGHKAISPPKFDIFAIFPNFLRC